MKGNIFRVPGPLCGEFIGPGEFPTQRPVTRNFDVFFDLRLNKRLNKQPRGWSFETPSWSVWRHCNVVGRGEQHDTRKYRLISKIVILLEAQWNSISYEVKCLKITSDITISFWIKYTFFRKNKNSVEIDKVCWFEFYCPPPPPPPPP